MAQRNDLEQIRKEYEAKQRNILWEDEQANAQNLCASLWQGNPESRPSPLIYAVLFFVLGVGFFAVPFFKDLGSGNLVAILAALGLLFLSCKLVSQSVASRKSTRSTKDK
jgi:hypothetical protein